MRFGERRIRRLTPDPFCTFAPLDSGAPVLLNWDFGCGGYLKARMSMVDGHPYKVEVGGSNPSVPTKYAPLENLGSLAES